MLRRLFPALLLPALLLFTTPALAGDFSILAGVGARTDFDGDANAIGILHVDWEMVSMLRLAGELHGYAGGPGVDGMDFADAQIGLMFDAPIPGWFGVEAGVNIGLTQALKARHGGDALLGVLKPELALTAEVGIFKARVAYQHNLLPFGDTDGIDLNDGQFNAMAGFSF